MFPRVLHYQYTFAYITDELTEYPSFKSIIASNRFKGNIHMDRDLYQDENRPRKTYSQNWPAYNAAQTSEKSQFLVLLKELCAGIEETQKQTKGRPRIPIQDAIFSACYKIYSTVSGRRFMSDLKEAHAQGHISRLPHYNSIFNYLENPNLTPILQAMITESSLPLKEVENDFAMDSSGFTAASYARWREHKYGERKQKTWVKLHLMCGVKTNVVTAVEIKGQHANDSPQAPALLMKTAENFTMHEVSADAGYLSNRNFNMISSYGAAPFIAFKGNSTQGRRRGTWRVMFHYFVLNREEFMHHYNKRSNVEATFSMIKAKFGGHVRSKTDVAMMNECLCKVICHNICCLIQASHELGIDVKF